MATTTNYGWTTPDDTALVKDGAAAIRTLGSSIDSTLKTQIDAQIPDSLLTTKGDIIAATGASTPARLGVGANDQVLIADSTTATGLKWGSAAAGGMTQLGQVVFDNTTNSIDVSSIPSTYKHLYITGTGLQNGAGQIGATYINFNNDTGSNYSYAFWRNTNLTSNGQNSRIETGDFVACSTDPTRHFGGFQMWIPNYASGDIKTMQMVYQGFPQGNGNAGSGGGTWANTTAINRVKISYAFTNNFLDGTITIYGVN
jgi:hypothetical protein